MVLSNIKTGQTVKIVKFKDELETKAILTSMGVIPGDHLEVVSKSPFGSPIFFKHNLNNFFALRRNQADLIEVE